MTKKDEITSQTLLCVYELVQKRPGPDELLFAGGYLDSFDMIQLIHLLEERFDLQFEPEEISLENFSSCRKIADLISVKLN